MNTVALFHIWFEDMNCLLVCSGELSLLWIVVYLRQGCNEIGSHP